MDQGADHYLTKETSYAVVTEKFMKGVVVFELPCESPQHPPLEIGQLFVPERSGPVCNTCNKTGHRSADCPHKEDNQICRLCHQKGHAKKDCPNFVCSNCDEQGHLAKNCTAKKQKKCVNCEKPGHISADCSKPCSNCGGTDHVVDSCYKGNSGKIKAKAEEAAIAKAKAAATKAATEAGPSTATPDATDTAMPDAINEATQDTVEDEDNITVGEPLGVLQLPDREGLSVKLKVTILDQHITSCSLHFQVSYPSNMGVNKLKHTSATVRFTCENIKDRRITVEDAEPASQQLQRLVDATTFQQLQDILSDKDADTSLDLYHISLTVENDCLLGEYFYANGNFGPFTPKVYLARDILEQNKEVTVHFFTISGSWVHDIIGQAMDSMVQQYENNPLLNWYPRRKYNVQKGMQLPAEERPQYALPSRFQFDSPLEYFTVQFYSVFAASEANSENPRVATNIRAIKFPGSGNRVYLGALEMTEDLKLRPDSILSVSFYGEDADVADDWLARVVGPLPFVSGYDYGVFLFRPRQGDAFDDEPNEFDERAIDSKDYQTAGELSTAVFQCPPTLCHVREHVPKVGMSREVNTLRYMAQSGQYTQQKAMLLANRVNHLDKYNFFASDIAMYGLKQVNDARHIATANLSSEQLDGFNSLEQMTGGIKLFQGVGGTGKSELLTQIIAYRYMLGVGCVDVLSSLNQQLDGLAQKTYDKLLDLHKLHGGRYPVVIRKHMLETEIKVYRQRAEKERAARDIETLPPYVEEGEFQSSTDDLYISYFIYRVWEDSNASAFDRRLKKIELSEATWALRFAGVRDSKGKMHPIARPDKCTEFRGLLERYGKGELTTPTDRMQLTLAYNEILGHLALVTDANFMTPDVASQARNYTRGGAPSVVLHDESGKMTETGALAGIVWSAVKSGGIPVPQILFGDLFQPKPTLSPQSKLFFHQQRQVSLFSRLIKAGFDTHYMWEQFRFVEPIANLINSILPDGRIRTNPSAGARDIVMQSHEVVSEIFGVKEPLLFITTKSTESVNDLSRSRFNIQHAKRTMWLVLNLLTKGIPAKHIGIGVFYTAQLSLYATALRAVEEWCDNQPEDGPFKKLAATIHEVKYFTIDGIQGGEVEFLIIDIANTTNLGFLADTARILLALGRARAALVLVGNPGAIEGFYAKNMKSYRHTAFYRMVKWFRDHQLYINLSRKDRAGTYSKYTCPVPIGEVLERVHKPHEFTSGPYDYSIDIDHEVNGLRFDDPDDDAQNDNDNDGDDRWDSNEYAGSDVQSNNNHDGDGAMDDDGTWDGGNADGGDAGGNAW